MSKKFASTIAGASIIITIVGLLSKAFGFLREVIFAAFFGLGTDFEVYLIAAVFPITINSVLLYLGQNYYIPIYSNIKFEGSKKENELFNRMLRMFFFAGFVLFVILITIIFVAIFVALARWIFRINDIVDHLEAINDKLNSLTSLNTKSLLSDPDIDIHNSAPKENESLKNDIPK